MKDITVGSTVRYTMPTLRLIKSNYGGKVAITLMKSVGRVIEEQTPTACVTVDWGDDVVSVVLIAHLESID